jgi:ComF family protein
MRSVVLFEREAREAVHLLKYGNRPTLAEPLARLMADYWQANPIPADLVTAVPLHSARQRERGYNQADLLARAFGRMIGVPVGSAVLRRVRHTRPQVSLNAAQRRENMQDAFAAAPPAQPSKRQGDDSLFVSGRRVLVIDDVRTTGSTLEACSLALKAAGASSVWGFTLARALYAAPSGDEGRSAHQNLDDKIPA